MSGRDEENISADMLTMDELRIIALYLSNFYIPFGTSLDGAESRDTSKENCKTALINLGFDKDLAEEIVEMVMAASLSSASQLYVNSDELHNFNKEYLLEMYEEYYADYEDIDDFDTTFFNYVGLGCYGTDPGVPIKDVSDDYLTFLNSGWSDGSDLPLTLWMWNILIEESNFVENRLPIYYISSYESHNSVFEFSEASSNLWSAIMRNADYSNGMCGNALFNDTAISNIFNKSTNEILSRTIFTQPIYVDWVGNILCDCGDERVIVIPACINPYAFSSSVQKYDMSTIDYNFNAISTFGMSILQDNSLFTFEIYEDGKVDISPSYLFLSHRYQITLVRGSRKEASWDTMLFAYGSDTDGAKLLKETLEDLGINTAGDDWAKGDNGNPATIYMSVRASDIFNTIYFSPINDELNTSNNTTYNLVYYNTETTRNVTSSDFKSVSVFDLLAGNGETKVSPFTDSSKFNTITGNSYHNFINFSSPVDLRVLKSIFVTYAFAYCNAFPSEEKSNAELDEKFTVDMVFNDIFPKVEGYLQFNHVTNNSNEMAEQTLSMIYYLLHPSEGVKYVSTLFKRKVGGMIIGWHEDIVGATESNYTTGGTKYLGMSSYVTTPSLRDIAWVCKVTSA